MHASSACTDYGLSIYISEQSIVHSVLIAIVFYNSWQIRHDYIFCKPGYNSILLQQLRMVPFTEIPWMRLAMVLLLRAAKLAASRILLATISPSKGSQKFSRAGFMIVSPSVKGHFC